MKWVIFNKELLYDFSNDFEPVQINDYQYALRVKKGEFIGYPKFNANEFRTLVNTYSEKIPEDKICKTIGITQFESKSAADKVPVVAIRKEGDDYETIWTHNFCDSSSWHIPSDSTWTLSPNENEILVLTKSECQWIHDLSLANSEIYLDYYMWIPNKEEPQLVKRITFSEIMDIFKLGNSHNTALSPSPDIPSGVTTVHFEQDTNIIFYGNRKEMQLSYMEISVKNHQALTGTNCTVSFKKRIESL